MINTKWDSSQELQRVFFDNYRDYGGIPPTSVNWSSENSDISFIWRYNFAGMRHVWLVTRSDAALAMLVEAVEWVLTMTDEALPKGIKYPVAVSWNPKRVEARSLSEIGYGKSPYKKLGPGWCRYIDKIFRPEILASGVIGYELACFIRDAWTHIDSSVRTRWLKHLARVFAWHEPNWRDEHTHPDGESFGVPHSGLKIAAYCWPRGIGAEVDGNIPGLNQQVQFLCMGLLVEQLTNKDIGAERKVKLFCEKTLPHLIERQDGCMVTGYDLRAHSKLNPVVAEPTNDGTHFEKSCPLFIDAAAIGVLPASYQDELITQILKVTHLGGDRMGVLQDGSTEHDSGDRIKNPGIAHFAGALGFENGAELLPLAEKVIAADYPTAYSHKGFYYHARYQWAKAGRPSVDCKQSKKAAKTPKKQPKSTKEKPKATTPETTPEELPKIITKPISLTMGDGLTGIVESRGSEGASVKSMGRKQVVSNPENYNKKLNTPEIMLVPIAPGSSTVVWVVGAQRYETPVTVAP